MFIITIDEEKCDGCGECVNICPVAILSLVDAHAVAGDSGECSGCESCVSVCKCNAITVTEI